jgi:Co/Zn/Cd efflux system component
MALTGAVASWERRRERTLLVGVLLSAWAPFVTLAAVLLSTSLAQLADFVRRTVEAAAGLVSWLVARRLLRTSTPPEHAARLERLAARAVAAAMALSGSALLAVVALRMGAAPPSGDVRLGLAVATLGLITNAVFWARYAKLAHERAGGLVAAQVRLYRAKVAVDAAVIAALTTVMAAPGSVLARQVDLLGSLVVACYVLASALRSPIMVIADGQRTARRDAPDA